MSIHVERASPLDTESQIDVVPEAMPGRTPSDCDVEPHANRTVGSARVSSAGMSGPEGSQRHRR
eukprot:6359584-Prorocentrum_lima.AAC.1